MIHASTSVRMLLLAALLFIFGSIAFYLGSEFQYSIVCQCPFPWNVTTVTMLISALVIAVFIVASKAPPDKPGSNQTEEVTGPVHAARENPVITV